MDEMNKIPEEQKDEELKQQEVKEPVTEEVSTSPAPKKPIKLPIIIGGIVAAIVVVAIAIAIILGGGAHEHKFGEWSIVNEPACIVSGLEERVCECGEKETRPVDALGHTEVVDNAVDPTCTATGLTEGKHCSVCGAVLVAQEDIAMKNHTYDDEYDADCNICGNIREAACSHAETEAIPGKAASCKETGLTEGEKCKKCGTVIVQQNEIPKTAHTYDDKYDEKCNVCGHTRDAECAHAESEVIPGKEATCTATGLTDGTKCKKCGEILTSQTSTPMKNHTYTSAVTEPTCSNKGYTTHTCSACGDSYKDTYTDTVAHSMGSWYVHTAPTFYVKGEERKDCANCDYYESREIATVGSEYTDPTLIVQNVTVNQGVDEVVLEVYIKNTPGIIAMTLQMNVDDNAFALDSAEKGDSLPSTALTVGKQTSSPYGFLFDAMELTEEDKEDGVLLTITLKVNDPSTLAKGEYNVTFSYTDGDIYDENFNTIDLQMVSGTITVK